MYFDFTKYISVGIVKFNQLDVHEAGSAFNAGYHLFMFCCCCFRMSPMLFKLSLTKADVSSQLACLLRTFRYVDCGESLVVVSMIVEIVVM